MKLLIGNGKEVTVRDVGKPLYRMEAFMGNMIPLHGYKIMEDDEARSFLNNHKHNCRCEDLTKWQSKKSNQQEPPTA